MLTRLFSDGEVPWIVSSHVFHTSTGPRAVDPDAAQQFNPSRRIGRLAVGHVIYHLEGNEYKTVEIRSIEQTKEGPLENAFALSTSQNHQTYHAHGYLVDVNTSSGSLNEIVDILRKVPGDRRLGLLYYCQELRSMFQKYEFQALYQRLNWELFGQYNSPDGRGLDGHGPSWISARPLNLKQHIKITNALSIPKGVAVDEIQRGFHLEAHSPHLLPADYKLPTLGLVDGHLIVQGEAQTRSAYISRDRLFRWTRKLAGTTRFEHGAFSLCTEALSGQGSIFLSSNSEAEHIPHGDRVHLFRAQACSLGQMGRVSESAAADDQTWHTYDERNVTLDENIWPRGVDRTKAEKPMNAGVLQDGYWKDTANVSVPSVRLPLLDNLRDAIKKNFGLELESLYEATLIKGGPAKQIYSVRLKGATLIPFISSAGLNIDRKLDIDFKAALGTDIKLPMLFQEMSLTFDTLDGKLTGEIFEYDPTMRGYRGNR